jgi:large exoprotein involved in heme utilization and adhesion
MYHYLFSTTQGNNISLADGSVIIVQNQGLLSSGGIALNAINSIQVSGTDPIARIPGSVRTETLTPGKSGDIVVSAPKLIVTEGGAIITATYSTGEAGNIILKAPDSIQVNGTSPRLSVAASNISSLAFSTGAAGDISVQTGDFMAIDGGLLLSTTGGSGAGGDIQIDATKSIELLGVQPSTLAPSSISAATFSTGNAGSVALNTSRLLIENGGRVDSSTLASGNAGSITVNPLDSVEIKGTVLNSRNPSLIISSGNILDEALQTSFGQVDELNLTGTSGDVRINTKQLTVTDGGLISVNNDGSGDAGRLEVFADSIGLDNKSGITAATTSGQGGTVFLQTGRLQLNNNSNVTPTANGGSKSGGNVTINTNTLVALNNSNITANAFEGNGGNIQISVQGLFLSPDSKINADSTFGVNGVVETQVLGFDVSNSLTPLNNNLVTTEQVIAGSCLARRNVERGSFVITGTSGLPINPYSGIERWDNLTGVESVKDEKAQSQESSLPPANNNANQSLPRKWQPGDPIVEAQALILKADGRASLIASSPQPEISNADSQVCEVDQAKI